MLSATLLPSPSIKKISFLSLSVFCQSIFPSFVIESYHINCWESPAFSLYCFINSCISATYSTVNGFSSVPWVSWFINHPSNLYVFATSISLSTIMKFPSLSFVKNVSNQSNLPANSVGGKNIVPNTSTPFLCAESVTSALGGTIIPSPADPPQ